MAGETIIITGGAGFIGSHAARNFALHGYRVLIIDDLSRPSAVKRIKILKTVPGIHIYKMDVADRRGIASILMKHRDAIAVFHFAAQVGVMSSLEDPVRDFGINAAGTLYLLDAMRKADMNSLFVFSSTNKVYGTLPGLRLKEDSLRYTVNGSKWTIAETEPIKVATPYGCSKRTAELYIREYQESFGLQSVILRQSCICGIDQLGSEEQGWVSWMINAHQRGTGISVFGNGKQVRDILDIRDYLELLNQILAARSIVAGKIYNVGGGIHNALSILELFEWLKARTQRSASITFKPERPSDQRYYVSDLSYINGELGWQPTLEKYETLLDMLTADSSRRPEFVR